MPNTPDDRAPPERPNPYNEEETARRRIKASRRAQNAPPPPDDGRKPKRPSGPEKYRGVAYSVTPHGDGQWNWKLRTRADDGPPPPSGTVRGRQNDAVEAAHRAIDKALGTQRK
jgi:hypothetical protein